MITVENRRKIWGVAALAVTLMFGVLSSASASNGKVQPPSRVPKPDVSDATGASCVKPVPYMRRHHGELLEHHRHDVLHKGIRTRTYNINNCIECHASHKNNSVIGTNQNFCQSCHKYVGVKLDCFECHNPKKVKVKGITFHPPVVPGEKPDSKPSLTDTIRKKMADVGTPLPEKPGVVK